jgi:hypothetical protein
MATQISKTRFAVYNISDCTIHHLKVTAGTSVDITPSHAVLWDDTHIKVLSLPPVGEAPSGISEATISNTPFAAGPSGVAVREEHIYRIREDGVEAISLQGIVKDQVELPVATCGAPHCLAVASSTLVVMTDRWVLFEFSLKGRTMRQTATCQVCCTF